MNSNSRAPAPAPTAATSPWTTPLQAKFRVRKATCRTRRIERAAMHQLERMTDRNLMDVGLSSEITQATVHGAARDRAFRRTR